MRLTKDTRGALVILTIFATLWLALVIKSYAAEQSEFDRGYDAGYKTGQQQGFDDGVTAIRDACFVPQAQIITLTDKETDTSSDILCMAAHVEVVRAFIKDMTDAPSDNPVE